MEVTVDAFVLFGLLALVSGLLVVIAAAVWWPVPSQQRLGMRDLHRRAERARLIGEVWPAGWPHEAPELPFTVAEAGRVLQRHRQCHIDRCARKSAAFRILLAAGYLEADAFRRL
ncbi:hypothetical protein ACFQZZ_10665 [Nocardia sp. GCM10030253]|uniref:hypothetical protein n=1 Tax=Nocardia sp. GCM10030253 TaxID=3273404 RepID=UPI003641D04A